jgi:hypothetical protein
MGKSGVVLRRKSDSICVIATLLSISNLSVCETHILINSAFMLSILANMMSCSSVASSLMFPDFQGLLSLYSFAVMQNSALLSRSASFA